jgi:hypothetical protein
MFAAELPQFWKRTGPCGVLSHLRQRQGLAELFD